MKKLTNIILLITLITTLFTSCQSQPQFDSQRAFEDLKYQLSVGPRIPNSEAHQKVRELIEQELSDAGWDIELQESEQMGQPVENIIAKRDREDPWIILGAHYDSRIVADQDPDPTLRTQPVPGANDGASGVAVLLELARVLPKELNKSVWLVFFDAEDNGNIPGNDWILGSHSFVDTLTSKPDKVVIIDMIGDTDLNIFQEKYSDPKLTNEIWETAKQLGYSQFIPELKYKILDDHVPFLQSGITAIDIIDFDFPYWHTTHDTVDKVSASSLQAVGDTLLQWLLK
jgi:glutaminyl-peptide cyclotransferase